MAAPFIDLWKIVLASKKFGGGGGGTSFKQVEITEKIVSTSIFTYIPENEEEGDE